MRRLFMIAALVFVGSCGSDLLGPVQTLDGQWSGIQGGYSMSLNMVQTGTTISGSVSMAGVAGFIQGSVAGSLTAQNVELTLTLDGADEPVKYAGTLSTENAKIFGKLNGSGLTNVEVDVRKR